MFGKKNKDQAKEIEIPFKELKFKEKIRYIWDYYRYISLALVLFIAFVASLIISIRHNSQNYLLYVAVVDGKMSGYDDGSDYLTKEMTERLKPAKKSDKIQFDYTYTFKANAMDQDPALSQNKIYLMASSSSIDGYMTSRKYIDFYSSRTDPFLTDLRTVLTTDELAKIGDENIFYYTIEDDSSIPLAVKLENTKICKDTNFTLKDACYGIPASSKHKNEAAEVIRFAFDL